MEYGSTLIVVYDYGSLPPSRISQIANTFDCRTVFVVPDTAHTAETMPLLTSVGEVITVADRSRADLVRACRASRPAGVVTFSEPQIRFTAWLAEELGCAFHSLSDVDAIVRKDLQRRRFAAAGLETIRFRGVQRVDQADEAMSHVGFPAVLKPAFGAASRNTIPVYEEKECREAISLLLGAGAQSPQETSIVLEELIVGKPTAAPWGDFIAVDCVSDGAEVHPRFVTSKFAVAAPFRDRGGYGGASVVTESELCEVRALAQRAVRALGIRQGISDVEIKLTPGGPRLIEVNGRLGGTVDDIAVRSGDVSPAEIAIKSALGLPYEIAPPGLSGPIAFHYHVIPPAAARSVARISSPLRIKRLPHVERVIIHVRPGRPVDWRAGTESRAASVIGATDTHGELADLVAEVEDLPWIEYQF